MLFYMEISLEQTLRASILSTSWPYCMLVLDTGKEDTAYGNCSQYKSQAVLKQVNF